MASKARPATSLLSIAQCLADPLLFLLVSASYLPLTIYTLLTTHQYSTLSSPSSFKDAWFAQFWSVIGPQTRENALPRAGPLIAQASGVVLDIGPGSGEWLKCFDKERVTKVWGVEPNRDMHEMLRRRVKEAGLEGVYEILGVGVEGLRDVERVRMGGVDTVVTIQVSGFDSVF